MPRARNPFISCVTRLFEGARDGRIASGQTAYMRNKFPFLGIQSAPRKQLQKVAFDKHKVKDEKELTRLVKALWLKEEREFQHCAIDLARKYHKLCSSSFLSTCEMMIREKSWWDTVDCIASHLVGGLVKKDDSLVSVMDEWVSDDCLWIRRTSLIYQLNYKQDTDHQRLFSNVKQLMAEEDFFIRKAIGWSLRQFARTSPELVCEFVQTHKPNLSTLSYREATKHLQHMLQ